MKRLKIFTLALILVLALTGCGGNTVPSSTDDENTEVIAETKEMFTNRDKDDSYETGSAINISLTGNTASCDSEGVIIEDNIITIKEEETYILSGTLTDGIIIVDCDETAKLQLVLAGADITSSTSSPLYILTADKVFLTLADDTENTLENGGSFNAIDENNIDGAVFSKEDITINGSGGLEIISPSGHGIVAKDDLVFTGGNITISAASHGIDANDSVRIADASVNISSGKDGIHCENNDDETKGFIYLKGGTLNIKAEGDGISSAAYTDITGGEYYILSGGGYVNGDSASSDNYGHFMGGPGEMGGPGKTSDSESTSMKGIKSDGDISITGGTFNIDSAGDSVHSNTSLSISGGEFEISSGDDAFHAEESLTIKDGIIKVNESYEGIEALNIDISGGNINISASDDGLNAAGGNDSSGKEGGRDGKFEGGGPGGNTSSNGSIKISGGEIYINASGDGIDSNGSLEITGGHTIVTCPTQGDTSTLDYDTTALISGGTFIGTGASGMAHTFSSSKNQGLISISVGNAPAGTEFILTDEEDNEILRYAPELSYDVVILSSPDIEKGQTYTISIDSTSGDFQAQ